MKKFIIEWNAGYGESHDVVEVATEEEAEKEAYECWREEAENNAEYRVVGEYTDELAEEYGV